MKFRNISNIHRSFKINGSWVVVAPGQEFDSNVYVNSPHVVLVDDEEFIDFDLNGDGKFDEKDASLCGKILNKFKKILRDKQ